MTIIYLFWECPKLINFFGDSPIKNVHQRTKNKKNKQTNKLWGPLQLINMSHTTLKSPKIPRPGSFEGHEILEENIILSIYFDAIAAYG
jgi:hypothetical protein